MTDDEVTPCTAIDNDWGDDRPNMLMHPPCACPRCAAAEVEQVEDVGRGWLKLAGQRQRRRVEAADLGALGRSALG